MKTSIVDSVLHDSPEAPGSILGQAFPRKIFFLDAATIFFDRHCTAWKKNKRTVPIYDLNS